MNVEISVSVLEKLIASAAYSNTLNQDLLEEVQTLLDSARKREETGELTRAEAYRLVTEEGKNVEMVHRDGSKAQYRYIGGQIQSRTFRIDGVVGFDWSDSEMGWWGRDIGGVTWRIVPAEPPKMDFVVAAKQCFDDASKVMTSEHMNFTLYAPFDNLIVRGMGSSMYFRKDYLALKWTVRNPITGKFYTKEGKEWHGR